MQPGILAELAGTRRGQGSRIDFSRIPARSGVAAATQPDLTPARNADLLSGGLQRRIGQGMPMDAGLRAEAESRFGANFSDVRIHDHPAAHHLARQRSARAFTIGSDIVFRDDHYRPRSQAGRLLLAHELAHVLQQRSGVAGAETSPAHEAAAEASARAVLEGSGPVSVGSPAAIGVQCQAAPSAGPASGPPAGPDLAAVAAEIDAELAEIEPLVTRLSAGVAASPADYALNEVRGAAGRLESDLRVVSQFASQVGAPAAMVSAAARFQTLRASFAAVVGTAERWHTDNPAGESLGMWNERQGTRLAGAGEREWEKGGWRTISAAGAYTAAGGVALLEAGEQLLSFGFHDAATAVSQAYTRGDISWNEGNRIVAGAAWRAVLAAAVTRGAGAATGRLGALAARGAGLAPTAVSYGVVAGGVSGGLTAAASLETQSLFTSGLQQYFASPAARAIWRQGIPSGKSWAIAIAAGTFLGGALGARAVQLNNAKLIGSIVDTSVGRLKIVAITGNGQIVLVPAEGPGVAPPAPPASAGNVVYDADTGSWAEPRGRGAALPPGQGPRAPAGALVPARPPQGALTATTGPEPATPTALRASSAPAALPPARPASQLGPGATRSPSPGLAVPPSATPAGEEVFAQITEELSLEAARAKTGGAASAAADAESAGLIGPKGAPGRADVALQSHGAASAVRGQYGVSGADMQSAHLGPTSYLRSVHGYSRSGAQTTLLDSDVHTALDNYWKSWSIQQRQAGRTDVSVEELYKVMLDAIDHTPGLAQLVKNTLSWRLQLELFQELSLKPGAKIQLPYPNVKPR